MSETPKYTTTPNRIPEGWTSGDLSVELSSRRTGMSFQRTRMSADRTLMSIIRTALSLIGFGFTIFQFFRYLRDNAHATEIVPAHAAINFSTALVVLGVIFLIAGIWNHISYMRELRQERTDLIAQGFIHGQSPYPFSLTLGTAIALLLLGLVVIMGMLMRSGPFH